MALRWDYLITPNMVEAGELAAEKMIDICACQGNRMGGALTKEAWIAANADYKNLDILLEYAESKKTAVEVIYLAMARSRWEV